MTISKQQAYGELASWLDQICHESGGPLIDDCMLTACKACGERAWISSDIKHRRGCEVQKMMRHLSTLEPKQESR